MPKIPPCALCKKVKEVLIENKKPFLVYSIFYLLIIEVVSYYLADRKNYACYWYPLLTNTGFFLIVFSIFLWNDRLRFCLRKNLAVLFLSIYYLFGSVAIICNVSNTTYTFWVSVGLLAISVITFILSIFKSE